MSAHTPGPWKFDTSTWYGYWALWNPETRQKVLVTGGRNDGDEPITWMGEDLSDADRALIEAAPDLLAALTRIAEMDAHQSSSGWDMVRIARAAIAKAGAA